MQISCDLPLYAPLVHANFAKRQLHVVVRLAANQVLGTPYTKEGPVVWADGKNVLIYRIPVLQGKSDSELHCLSIDKLPQIPSADNKRLESDLAGIMVYIETETLVAESTMLKSATTESDGDGDDEGRGTVIIWDNGTR